MIDLRNVSESCTTSPIIELIEILESGRDRVEILAHERDIPEKVAKKVCERAGYKVISYERHDDGTVVIRIRKSGPAGI